MGFPSSDKAIIRDLAKRIAAIAALPIQQERKDLWMRLNRLERVRPLVMVKDVAPSLWDELPPKDEMQCVDPFCREQEYLLRKQIYAWEHYPDDRVITDTITCRVVYDESPWGPTIEREDPKLQYGAKRFISTIETEKDLEKINAPLVTPDWEATERLYGQLCDLYDGVFAVQKRGVSGFNFAALDMFIRWRGIQEMFTDLAERPEFIHHAMERMTSGFIARIEQMEQLGMLSPCNNGEMLGPGGYAWTDQLPLPGYDGKHARLKDCWGRATTQIFTESISPAMHEEFATQYERRVVERAGLSGYGCCEPLHNKMPMLRKIKNLRRVSMSPWVDMDKAAAEVGKDYIYTHKPNPALLSMEHWDPDLVRSKMREALHKTRENLVEVNLQDLHTLRGEPWRLDDWMRIAMETAEEYA
jgi:hypothetical protein